MFDVLTKQIFMGLKCMLRMQYGLYYSMNMICRNTDLHRTSPRDQDGNSNLITSMKNSEGLCWEYHLDIVMFLFRATLKNAVFRQPFSVFHLGSM